MNKKKVLFIATVAGHIHTFHRPYLKWFHDQGYEVHVACNGEFSDIHVSKVWNVDFERSPVSLSNFKSLFQLGKIINKNEYLLISCHTPVASVLSRLSSITARRNGTRLLYTAHGFHFFKGGSLWSWLTYYPVEVGLSYLTDAIICINQEDFDLIREKGSSSTNYYLIPGIGVDSSRFQPLSVNQKMELRDVLNVDRNNFVMVYAAEFIDRKNHKLIINAIRLLSSKIDHFIVFFAGIGALLDELKEYVTSCGLDEHVRFLGYVTDIEKYFQISDVALSSSKQEGLGINLVEAMMCGAPVIATVDRGHCTVVDHKVNGILFPQNDSKALADAIFEMYKDDALRLKMSEEAIRKASRFEVKNSLEAMSKVYLKFLD
ncbi:glycosyltransferase family 4 protein [Psychrobacter urativorans]|uniref:glycosyltransferase family 4 protein n=1 Tax=Psychrobacter urativorans TaxID=45610 RepID=UPI0019197A85|nr:glycosyltransferase family 4 protein [Psychrobacter urativorans]